MDDATFTVLLAIVTVIVILYILYKLERKKYIKSLGNNYVNSYKGIYIKGCSDVYDAGFKIRIFIFTDSIYIKQIDKESYGYSIEIPMENVVDINFNTKESIGDRVTVPKVFLFGLFAFAFKKSKTNVVKYVVISYEREDKNEDIILQVDDSSGLINDIKNQIK
ncbi:hypothetical protein [Clostridium sp. 001]|uniref:hypothetical protein n=1 Tax=Clostridium sp. 001 TaxID=1970093 RepID=UPI001C2BB052|nr:hypothetical protein [Clostridium sp. 001]QXE20045.1 hypothetical protein B5S50_15095 [Clostridium sp. 001]